MQVEEIAPNVFQLKVVDFAFRRMHTFDVTSGTSFNAYLIVAEDSSALIDTMPAEHVNVLVDAMRSRLGKEVLKYVVINHAEPDAAEGLLHLLKVFPDTYVVCTRKCIEFLQLQSFVAAEFDNFYVVDAKSSLPLQNCTLKFFPTPLLHWQEYMCCFIDEQQVYFTSDLYGYNMAATEIFADYVNKMALLQEGKAYLCQVFGALQTQVKKAYEITALAKMVCPQHGLILRDALLAHFRQLYYNFHLNQHVINKICIIYDSMYGSTAKMAQIIGDGIKRSGGQTVIFDVKYASASECLAHAFESRAICLGSPTLNFGCMPRMVEVLAQFQASYVLNNKKAVIFGAYGWSSGSSKEIGDLLKGCGCLVFKTVTWKLSADEKEIEAVRQAGKEFWEAICRDG